MMRRISELEMELAGERSAHAARVEENTVLRAEAIVLKAENAELKEKLEAEKIILLKVGEPFNEYAKAKWEYARIKDAGKETVADEKKMTDALAAFLRAVLELCHQFLAGTQSEQERELLRMFVDEQKRIFDQFQP